MNSNLLRLTMGLVLTVTSFVSPNGYGATQKSNHISIGFIGDNKTAHVTVNDQNVITIKANEKINPLIKTKEIAQNLNELLNEKQLRPDSILPAIRNGKYIARVNEKTIFSVDEKIAKTMKNDPAQLTMKWVNNLRLALGGNQVGYRVSRSLSVRSSSSSQVGYSSWYGSGFHGRPTASGEAYNMYKFTAAHRTLPLGTPILVTNLANGRSVMVKVNDRGPYADTGNRVIDLSQAAFSAISPLGAGVIRIKIDVMR
ncbi:MAG: septal ring lytic transglycosylase RlpA family protein [Candidatus Sericytochromatia bacterium]